MAIYLRTATFSHYLLRHHLAKRTLLSLYTRDILNGLFQTGRYDNLLAQIPTNIINELEDDATDAGIFVCQILAGDTPEAFEGLAQDILDEAGDEFASLTSFILGIPTLAPEILDDLVQDGEDVVSIIGELFTDPGAALTAIGGAFETIGQDIETVVLGIGCDLGFGGCPPAPTTGTIANTGLAVLESSCSALLANDTPASTTAAAASSTIYSTAVPSTTYSAAASLTIYSTAGSSTTFSTPSTTSVTIVPAANTATIVSVSTTASPSIKININDGAANSSNSILWLWLAPLAIITGLMMLL